MNPLRLAQNYADSLYENFSPNLCYHNSRHAQDVRASVKRLAKQADLLPHSQKILDIAALYHDIGFLHTYEGHEEEGILIVQEKFPEFGFSEEDISSVTNLIRATKLPQTPLNELAEFLCDADLDNLGRQDFLTNTEMLFLERSKFGFSATKKEWFIQTLEFIKNHEYFTSTARALRDEGKKANIQLLEQKIRQTID